MKLTAYSTKRKRNWKPIAAAILAAGILLALVLVLALRDKTNEEPSTAQPGSSGRTTQNSQAVSNVEGGGERKGEGENEEKGEETSSPPAKANFAYRNIPGMTAELAAQIGPAPITTVPADKRDALIAMDEGMQRYIRNADLLEARMLLNTAYTSGHFDADALSKGKIREALEDLAGRTVLRQDSAVNRKDPYLLSHTFGYGEQLGSIRREGKIVRQGVIAQHALNVQAGVLVWVNGLGSGADFKAGRSYKMLRGPFHLVIYKSEFAADLYLQDLFVRRMKACIGAEETPTPEGYFRIHAKGRSRGSTYYPPAESGRPNIGIMPHEKGYPLDAEGHNLKIEGIPELGTQILVGQSYAIHGTNDPSSLGAAASRGCIRFGDEDIKLLYGCLQEHFDANDPNIPLTRWSTIWVRP
jgi:hypothetical protein